MKKSHILGIVVIAIAVIVIISSVGDASSYVTFEEAKTMAQSGKSKMVHVVGQLNKDHNGEVLGIETSNDKLSFSFQMVDNNQAIQKVLYKEPMPPDFMRSEQVVVVGNYHNDLFVADQILLKCPSKYQEESVRVEGIDTMQL
jgi:cytochrome c-type biogenesis protein CcmE